MTDRITLPEIVGGKPSRGVMTLVVEHGRILAIPVGPHWTLPGAVLRLGETDEDGQKRGLLECVGLHTCKVVKIYEGPNTTIFLATIDNTGLRYPGRCSHAWLTEAEFLKVSDRTAVFTRIFGALREATIAASKVVQSNTKGECLYAIQYETRTKGGEWEPHDAHYLHALNAGDARVAFMGVVPPDAVVRVVGVAPAIGFFRQNDGTLLA